MRTGEKYNGSITCLEDSDGTSDVITDDEGKGICRKPLLKMEERCQRLRMEMERLLSVC